VLNVDQFSWNGNAREMVDHAQPGVKQLTLNVTVKIKHVLDKDTKFSESKTAKTELTSGLTSR
jgi:hypothetical protein